ncbi:cellulose binding domain-containing protein [Paractinoplanes lichenicola]|uniref:Cellulose binding domain-containing protein n=1 Tax=Paractinoplanes lichenicola TaxID=2802976 RepID=A0ABS1VFQ6_9ACTN|nr:cellulose binding domain-containing protein [Actinoplanes lichenicola]MBL7253519.1 cellulose binding domain-containing protein [Actinoplanes lichenicola]
MRHLGPRKAAALAAVLAATGIAVATGPAQAATGCSVRYTVTSQWQGGFGAEVAVTNLGDPVTGWTLTWAYGSGQQVTQAWNATVTQSGSQVSARNASYNGTIATGATVSLGFNGSWTGSNPVPTGFAVNGVVCGGDTLPTTPPPGNPGCGRAPTLADGTHTIQSGGKSRSFILRLPRGYDSTNPYRIIFAFHWRGGSATDVSSGGTSGAAWSYYGQQEQSDNTAILVAPQGLNAGWANSGGEDVTFVDDMIRRIESDLCVDPRLRFATGFSYGGGMSYALACARPNVFRAVAVFSGAQISGCSGGSQPVAYLGIHGISDNVLPIAQGRALRDKFVATNGCTPQNPREPAAGSRTHITTAYAGCRAGYPVVWAAFDGGHLPGHVDGSTAESGVTTWTKGEVWKFFAQFQGER